MASTCGVPWSWDGNAMRGGSSLPVPGAWAVGSQGQTGAPSQQGAGCCQGALEDGRSTGLCRGDMGPWPVPEGLCRHVQASQGPGLTLVQRARSRPGRQSERDDGGGQPCTGPTQGAVLDGAGGAAQWSLRPSSAAGEKAGVSMTNINPA